MGRAWSLRCRAAIGIDAAHDAPLPSLESKFCEIFQRIRAAPASGPAGLESRDAVRAAWRAPGFHGLLKYNAYRLVIFLRKIRVPSMTIFSLIVSENENKC